MTFFDRVQALCKSNGISIAKMERDLGFSNGSMRKLKLSGGVPSASRAQSISSYFDVSLGFLMNGDTERDQIEFRNDFIKRITAYEKAMIDKYRTLDSHGKHNIDYLLDAEYSRVQQIIAASKGEAVDNSTTIAVPLLQNALSGKVIGTVPVLAKGSIYDGEDDLRAVQVTKDTMAPRFSPGDTLIYRRQSDVQSGDIAIIIIDGQEAVCKKVIKDGDTIKLVPLNNKYETKVFHIDDIKKKRLEIIGRVVENIQAV